MPPPITRSKKARISSVPAPDSQPELPETLDGQTGQKSKLPPELLRNIVEEVALSIPDAKSRNHALYTLMLTSRDLHPEARRLLYRDVTFVNKSHVAGQIADALHAGAAKYVRSLCVENFDIDRGSRGRAAKTHFYHLPLRRMDGLQSLVLRGPPWPEDASVITDFLISSIPANTLLKFHVLEYLNSALLQFFQQQNKLQFLSLRECDDRDNLTMSLQSPQMMPNLKRLELFFTRDNNRFQELVEARPITVFHLSTVVLLPPCWSTFAPRLHALDISNSYIREYQIGEVLETLSTTAVNLRLFACFQVNYFPGAIPRSMPAGYRALSKFRHLEALSVSFCAEFIGQLDVMTIPTVFSPPAQLKSIFLMRRVTGAAKQSTQELQYDSGSGWITSKREGLTKEDWFELYLCKLGL